MIGGRTISADTGGDWVPLTDYLTVYRISAGTVLDPELAPDEIAHLACRRDVSAILSDHG